MPYEEWRADRLDDLADLWAQACPAEPLSVGELRTVLVDDGGTILASDDGLGVVAFAQGAAEASSRGNVRLLAVAPRARRQGRARALLGEAESRLRDAGVGTVRLAGGVPRYLWPGIDATNRPARRLAEGAGYHLDGQAVNMAISTGFRAVVPAGIEVRPAGPAGTADARGLRDLIAGSWPLWLTEVDLAAARGTLVGAWRGQAPVGFIAHSTLRAGWIGPMGTDPGSRARGVGSALLSATCADLESRGQATGIIAWVGPVDYFAARGARLARTFERYVKDLR